MRASIQDRLVAYLRKTYKPKAILLAGSRASDRHSNDSDWDLFVFVRKKRKGGFSKWENETLDISFQEWSKPKDFILANAYTIVQPVKVLFDATNGELEKMLVRTQKAYRLGPQKYDKIGCASRLRKLDRWKFRMKKFEKRMDVQFYYAGYFYEFALRAWFEQQNRWPEPPAVAFQSIKKEDRAFERMLHQFTTTHGKTRTKLTSKIVTHLHSLKPKRYGN